MPRNGVCVINIDEWIIKTKTIKTKVLQNILNILMTLFLAIVFFKLLALISLFFFTLPIFIINLTELFWLSKTNKQMKKIKMKNKFCLFWCYFFQI